jgi:hypothetical protein
VVHRSGKGGSNDPFLYTIVLGMVTEDGNIIASSNLVDPGLEVSLSLSLSLSDPASLSLIKSHTHTQLYPSVCEHVANAPLPRNTTHRSLHPQRPSCLNASLVLSWPHPPLLLSRFV